MNTITTLYKRYLSTRRWLFAVFAIGLFSVTSSCKKFLEVNPANVVAVSSYQDIRQLLGGHLLRHSEGNNVTGLQGPRVFFYTRGDDYLITHFYSDDYDVTQYLNNYGGRNNQGKLYQSLDWRNIDFSEGLWQDYFANIGFYNMILAELKKHPAPTSELNEQVSGEAKVLRAWIFFRLMQYFSPYKRADLGLPLNTDPDAIGTYDSRRRTQQENYNFIISELEEVLAYKGKPSPTYNIYFDRRVIHGLLAQVYHYKGGSGAGEPSDYDQAIKHAKALLDTGLSFKEIINAPTASDNYGINKTKAFSPFVAMFNDANIYSSTSGDTFYGLPQYASQDLYNLFDDTDKRKSKYFENDRTIIKYSYSGFPYDMYQWNFFTAAEMQLIIAESYARKGQEAEARQALGQFTAERYTTYTQPAGKTLLEAILIERRKEFCFEYTMRWLDLTRLQPALERPAIDKQDGSTYKMQAGDFRYTLPLPRIAELKDNPIAQNPGWGQL